MKNIRFIAILLVVGMLLLIPFVAMQLGVDGMKWTFIDFAAAAIMLLGAGIGIEIALRVIGKFKHRVAACFAILAILALVWVEIAVGLFGSPLAGS